jgi:peptide/nickel transport system substrate-binding protein
MSEVREHPHILQLKQELADNRLSRREFLRVATLLGVSASAAYAIVGLSAPAFAQPQMPKGGRLRIAMQVFDISNPRRNPSTSGSNLARQVCEYLTITHHDNVTRPYLLERWEASDDLKTWLLRVRREVKWRNGRQFTAEDVIWNIKNALDPATGSSILGLMRPYMLTEVETTAADGKVTKTTRLWDANAIEKVDDFTVRLNLKQAQLAVPEHLFHYPFNITDPAEGGVFKPGANGTGAFELVDLEVGKRAVYRARKDYWGTGPYLDQLEFVDLGGDPSAMIAALQSRQVDGVQLLSPELLPAVKGMQHLNVYAATTAQTGVARVK